tara:strand:- start:42 stop:395 length:354 start_codon:yes stop_codon:yes gene_type:complete
MKLNELLNEKQLDEIAPLIPLGWAAGKAIAGYVGKHAIQHGAKKVAGIGGKVIKKTPPTPGDGSEMKSKVGYGAGQVDPPLAQAAKKKSLKMRPSVASNKFGKSLGPMSNLNRRAEA